MARRSLLFFTFSLFCLLTLPRLLGLGMFFDGLQYASVARNLAQGYGTWFHLQYTDTLMAHFYEHPPVGFWLESLWFQVLGDHLWVEKLWGFTVALALGGVTAVLWRKVTQAPWGSRGEAGPKGAGEWWPLMLLVFNPLMFWIVSNNMLELPMAVFSLLAALAGLLAVAPLKKEGSIVGVWKSAGWGVAGGGWLLLAGLTKGPAGLFPLAAPVLAWLILAPHPGQRAGWVRAGAATLAMGLTLGVGLWAMVRFSPQAADYLNKYLSNQLMASLEGKIAPASTRFLFAINLAKDFLLAGVVAAGVWWAAGRPPLKTRENRGFFFFFSLALAGSLPMGLSPKQSWWHIFASYPFYALALAALFRGSAEWLEERTASPRRQKKMVWTGGVLLLGGVAAMAALAGTPLREKSVHQDLLTPPVALPPLQLLSVCPAELFIDWHLMSYLQRQYRASLTTQPGSRYLLIQTGADCSPGPGCGQINPPQSKQYRLYDCGD